MLIDDDFLTYHAGLLVKDEKLAGTGLAISKSHVLTAKHVIYTGNEINNPVIEVYFRARGNDEKPIKRKVNDTHLIDESKLVILELEKPLDGEPFFVEFGNSIDVTHSEEWVCFGYPQFKQNDANVIKVCKDQKAVRGKFESKTSELEYLQLTTNTILPKAENWKGISGGAIVSNGLVYGIFEEANSATLNDVSVISIPYLYGKNDSFRKWVKTFFSKSYDHQEILHKTVRANLERVLDDDPKFKKIVERKLGNSSDANGAQLVEKLLSTWNPQQALDKIYLALEKSKGASTSASDWVAMVESGIDAGRWLLLLSIKPEAKLSDYDEDWVCDLEDHLFTEVVVSHRLVQRPDYVDAGDGTVKPSVGTSTLTVYDSFEKAAFTESVMKLLYKDLRTVSDKELPSYYFDDYKLLIAASIRSKVRKRSDDANPSASQPTGFVYYLMDEESFRILNSVPELKQFCQELQGQLRFIQLKNQGKRNASEFNDRDLLAALYDLFALKKQTVKG